MDDRLLCDVARGTAGDVDAAVTAASHAAEAWGRVPGLGPEVGTPLVEDPRVGLVSFTGSAATGKSIQQRVSARGVLAKVCLELGGKNPLIVCDDADMDAAAEHATASAFIDAGQRCAA